MALKKPRYLVIRPGARGQLPRYYWVPSKALRAEGFAVERVPLRPDDFADPAELLGAAVTRIEQLNGDVDRWRQGLGPAPIEGERLDVAGSGGRAARSRAKVAAEPTKPRSLRHLMALYKKSRFYLDLAKTTRDGYLYNMRYLDAWGGAKPVAAIDWERAETLYRSIAEPNGRDAGGKILDTPIRPKPSKATHVLMMLYILLEHAMPPRLNWIRINPCAKFGLRASPFSGKLWPTAAVELVVEQADRMGLHSVGTAIVIDHWLGQRIGDVVALPRLAYYPDSTGRGRFRVRQQKTGAWVDAPAAPWVLSRIEAELARQRGRGVESVKDLLLCESTGQKWKLKTFQHTFNWIREKAAEKWPVFETEPGTTLEGGRTVRLDQLQLKHFRHNAVTNMFQDGVTESGIATFSGHSLNEVRTILDRYFVRTSAQATEVAEIRIASGRSKLDTGDA